MNARFVTSAADPAQFPPESLPEVAVVGRSNVGKSSLINALVGRDLARTSRTPGRTRLVNWFEVDSKLYLVDLPGYGWADVSRELRDSWRPLIEAYLTRDALAAVLLLVDIRRGAQDEELDFVPWLKERDIAIAATLTKADKLAKNKRILEATKARRTLGLARDPFTVSALTGAGVEALRRAIFKLAAAPRAATPEVT
jgi:GTP-binding protein